MDSVSQGQTISEMNQEQNQLKLTNPGEYISPLAAHPTLPVQHYNSDTSKSSLKSLPKKQFGGYCDLCKIKLNSYLQSKSHYEGKPHAKMVKKKEEETRQASSTTVSPEDEPPNKKARTVPVANLYCGACNLTFTSEVHAKDHYLGRNHARVLHGLAPYTQGYFNTTTNKWQRTPPDPRVSAQLLSSEPPADMEGKPARQDKPKIRGKSVEAPPEPQTASQ